MSIVIWVVSLGVVSFILALRSMKEYTAKPLSESRKHITHQQVVKESADEKKRGPIHGTIVQL